VKPAKPSHCVDVLVKPRSKPASTTRFFHSEYDGDLCSWSFQVLVCAIGRKHLYLVPSEGRTDLTPINFQFNRVARPFALMAIASPPVALSFEQSQSGHVTQTPASLG